MRPDPKNYLDQNFALNYQSERNLGNILTTFTLLGILIACLGLYGLTSFIGEQRTKEVGVRKVLGASATKIITLFSKDFITLVLIAIFLASPFVYYFMNEWIQNFPYRTEISLMIFVSAGLLSIILTLLTISYQAYKAARTNPVNSLKCE